MQLLPYLLKHTQLPEKGINNTVSLLEEDCTILLSPVTERKKQAI